MRFIPDPAWTDRQRDPQSRGASKCLLPTVLAIVALACLVAGCGKDNPTDNGNVDVSLAVPGVEQASSLEQVAESEAAIDAVEEPMSSAAGDVEDIGDVIGDTGVGDYGSAGMLIAAAVRGLEQGATLGASAGMAMQAAALQEHGPRLAATESCTTTPQPDGGTLTVCVQQTDSVNVVRVSMTRTSPLGPVTSSYQVFYVNNNGTPANVTDDRILSYRGTATLHNGTTIDLSMLPSTGEFIVDNSRVDVTETIRRTWGSLQVETVSISMNVGVVKTDGDEIYYGLTAQMQYRNGASADMQVSDRTGDGITNGDSVRVTSQFTAAASNPRLQTTSATLDVLVHDLGDPSDDQVMRFTRHTVYDGQTASGGPPTCDTEFVPASPVSEGQEPCGGRLTKNAVFPASWETRSLALAIQISCGSGGSSTLDLTFSDGSSSHRTITWDAAGHATLAATRRDGTTVSGQFDRTTHSFVIDTTYPAGNDPVSTHQEGSADRETHTRSYLVIAVHQNASQDTLSVQGQAPNDSTRTITGWTTTSKGHVEFSMTADLHSRTLSGSASGPQDQTLVFTITPLEDEEGALLEFTYQDPAQRLTVVGEIVLDGDGSGCGTLTITQGPVTKDVPVCFEPDGDGTIDNTIPF